jgi:hypothetical protein
MNDDCPFLADSVCVAPACRKPGPCLAKDPTGRPQTAFELMGRRHNSMRRNRVPDSPAPGQKYCPACGKLKQLSEFCNDACAPSGKNSYCRECKRAKSKARWQRRAMEIDKAKGYHGRLNDDL